MPNIHHASEAKMKVEIPRTFRRPKISESEADGRLMSIPRMVEAEAQSPIGLGGVPMLVAKGLRTGFLNIVELNSKRTNNITLERGSPRFKA